MTSKFQVNNLEWCTDLPSKDCPRKSPLFLVNGSECFFQFVLEYQSETWYFNLYLEFKCTHTEFKPCSGKLKIFLVEGETLMVNNKAFDASEPTKKKIWCIPIVDLNATNHLICKGIKFIFSFDYVDQSILKICKEVDDKSVQTPLYIDTSFLLKGVSNDLSTLFDEGPDYDVEFICRDKTFKAHKNIVTCRSEVFASMLQTEMVEGKTGQVKIQDIEDTIFEQFLRYLYTGILPELTVDTALQMYEAADKYDVKALTKQCASFLVEHLSPENACEILIISDRHNDPDFKKSVMEYVIQENVPFRGETLTNFCKDNSRVAAEVLNLLYQNLPLKEKTIAE